MTIVSEREQIGAAGDPLSEIADPTLLPRLQAFDVVYRGLRHKKTVSFQDDSHGVLSVGLGVEGSVYSGFVGGLRYAGLIRSENTGRGGTFMISRENALIVPALLDTLLRDEGFVDRIEADGEEAVRSLVHSTVVRLGPGEIASRLEENFERHASDIGSGGRYDDQSVLLGSLRYWSSRFVRRVAESYDFGHSSYETAVETWGQNGLPPALVKSEEILSEINDSSFDGVENPVEDAKTFSTNGTNAASEVEGETVVFNAAGVMSGDEIQQSDQFPGLIDLDLAKLFGEHPDTFTPNSEGFISYSDLKRRLGDMLPSLSYRTLEGFFIYVFTQRNQFAMKKIRGKNFFTPYQAMAVGTLLNSHMKQTPVGVKRRNYNVSTLDAQGAWREGSEVYELLRPLDKPRGKSNQKSSTAAALPDSKVTDSPTEMQEDAPETNPYGIDSADFADFADNFNFSDPEQMGWEYDPDYDERQYMSSHASEDDDFFPPVSDGRHALSQAERDVMWETIKRLKDERLKDLATATEVLIHGGKWPMPLKQFLDAMKAEMADGFSVRHGDIPSLFNWLQESGMIILDTHPQTSTKQIDSNQLRAATLAMAAIRKKIGPVQALHMSTLSPRETYSTALEIGQDYPGLRDLHDPNLDATSLGNGSENHPGASSERKKKGFQSKDGQSKENYMQSSSRALQVERNKKLGTPKPLWDESLAFPTLDEETKARVDEVFAEQAARKRGHPKLDDDLAKLFYAKYSRLQLETVLREMFDKGDNVASEILHPLTIQVIRYLNKPNRNSRNEFDLAPDREIGDFRIPLRNIIYKMMRAENPDVTLYDFMARDVEMQLIEIEKKMVEGYEESDGEEMP